MKKRVKGCTWDVLNAVEAVCLWLAAGCAGTLAACNAARDGLAVATALLAVAGVLCAACAAGETAKMVRGGEE